MSFELAAHLFHIEGEKEKGHISIFNSFQHSFALTKSFLETDHERNIIPHCSKAKTDKEQEITEFQFSSIQYHIYSH